MAKYYHLKIKQVVKETPNAVSLHFWHPWNEVIQYKPGQYLTILWPNAEGEKIRRSYSLSSSPYTDASPAITIKRINGGLVSDPLVSDAKEGDILEVMQPMGTFCLSPNSEKKRSIFLLGTGSGITPLLSIAKSVLIVEPESTVFLLYGNRREEDIIFKSTLEQLSLKYGERFQVTYSLTEPSPDWQGETGRLTPAKITALWSPLSEIIKNPDSQFFICGQEEFMTAAGQTLITLGAGLHNVHRESFFSSKKSGSPETGSDEETSDEPKSHTITLRYEGTEYSLEVPPHQTVLEAALSKEIELPYSCQAGMCTACMGRVLQGEVRLDEYDGLTEAEVREGFVLTCVAHPQSDDVVIEVE